MSQLYIIGHIVSHTVHIDIQVVVVVPVPVVVMVPVVIVPTLMVL